MVIKIGEKEISIGFDVIYQALSNFLLRHTEMAIRNKEAQILGTISEDFQDIDIYLKALNFIVNNEVTDAIEKDNLKGQIQRIKNLQYNKVKCMSLAKILLEQVGSEEEVRRRLKQFHK